MLLPSSSTTWRQNTPPNRIQICIRQHGVSNGSNVHIHRPEKLESQKALKLSRKKSWRLRAGTECWASVLTLTFGTTRPAERWAPRASAFTPKEIARYSFLLEAEWTTWLKNADRTNRSIENFRRSYRESNPKLPVLWRTYLSQLRQRSPYNSKLML
jgi:hypothetical protein